MSNLQSNHVEVPDDGKVYWFIRTPDNGISQDPANLVFPGVKGVLIQNKGPGTLCLWYGDLQSDTTPDANGLAPYAYLSDHGLELAPGETFEPYVAPTGRLQMCAKGGLAHCHHISY